MILKDKLFGLVLSGGKSTRMGVDKGSINYHGIPHREYLLNLLGKLCDEVFLSVSDKQMPEVSHNVKIIVDENQHRGPFNGLLSAHHKYPDAAWLVLACDLPLIDEASLAQLIRQRNPKKFATAFATHASKLPEPLCAIWESLALQKAEENLNAGAGSCPRKFLINSDIQLVFPEDDKVLFNANSMEDYNEVITKL